MKPNNLGALADRDASEQAGRQAGDTASRKPRWASSKVRPPLSRACKICNLFMAYTIKLFYQ